MGLAILGCLGFVLILVIVFLILAGRFISIWIKKGFKNTIKTREGIILLVLISLLIGLPALSVYAFVTPHSGKQLFEIYLLNPVPKSVEIIDSYDGGPDLYPETCLHFKIAPADLKMILEKYKWEPISKTKFSGIDCGYQNKEWDFSFPPPALGENVKMYTFIPYKRDFEYLFFNAQMNEAYFYNYDEAMP
jgi:hypothetical protein